MRFKNKKEMSSVYREEVWPGVLSNIRLDGDGFDRTWEYMVESAEMTWAIQMGAYADVGDIPERGRHWKPPVYVKSLKV